MEEVILVDSKDNNIGKMEKLEAHKQGQLHRAFSVLLFNDKGEMLLQKRADSKYHSPGLWTNTCCSHPRPDEDTQDAAERRLKEEMGIHLRPEFVYKFIYKTQLDNELTEHEYDHVYIGEYNDTPTLAPEEASDWKFMSMHELKEDVNHYPDNYTVWFKIILESIDRHIHTLNLS
ncbi:isopentenyl-diphosphate Delta-isomerase [Fulvivirga sp. RKSG066]|uniref:isopentenyl-diphosphate Delta-isomerase n=1 Tax=Fulvivirga aurantia TaxID=2529383 RepID=UPI0012BC58DB|nr:isopentenyl-diphosphate Delta-isomerase [Fulvivirga aurantia]MTI22518.1 isopentenyl-diphosphate Delta-isomerase [Fulvivirga aurantia]